MNASTSLDWKLTLCLMSREFLELFCLVLRLFQVQLHIYVQVHLYCLVVFVNWNGHCGKLPRAAFCGKLVQSIEGADCMRAAVEYRPLSLFITVNSTVKCETIITTV